jgi:hypothetical protein
VTIRKDAVSRIATVSAEVTSTTGALIVAPRDADHRVLDFEWPEKMDF